MTRSLLGYGLACWCKERKASISMQRVLFRYILLRRTLSGIDRKGEFDKNLRPTTPVHLPEMPCLPPIPAKAQSFESAFFRILWPRWSMAMCPLLSSNAFYLPLVIFLVSHDHSTRCESRSWRWFAPCSIALQNSMLSALSFSSPRRVKERKKKKKKEKKKKKRKSIGLIILRFAMKGVLTLRSGKGITFFSL
ncbi:hypothetical protein IWX47DRAFT_42932 [Phyllosticta citricarpa]